MARERKRCSECKGSLTQKDIKEGAIMCDACACRIDTMFSHMSDEEAARHINMASLAFTAQPVPSVKMSDAGMVVTQFHGGPYDGGTKEYAPAQIARISYVGMELRRKRVAVYDRRGSSFHFRNTMSWKEWVAYCGGKTG